MGMQTLLVGVIVALCALGASWSLMPGAARRACARAALRLPWPAPVAARWRQAAQAQSGCDGCKHAPAGRGAAPIRVVRKAASTKHGRGG